MKGHKRERGPNQYQLSIYLGKDPVTGKQRYQYATFHGGSRAADDELHRLIAEQLGKKTTTKQTLAWLVEVWIDLQEATLSKDTIRTYRGYAKKWIYPSEEEPHRIGVVELTDLTSGHLRELHAQMARDEKKPSTIRQVHNIVRGALTYGVEREWIDHNVAAVRKAPSLPASEVVACTDDELARLLDGAGDEGCDLWTAIALGAMLGRRLGQLCTIRHSAIDLDARTITMRPSRKSPKAQVLPIDEVTAEVLKKRLEWQQGRWERVAGLAAPVENPKRRHPPRTGMHATEQIADPYLLSRISTGGEATPNGYSHAMTWLRDKLDMPDVHFHSLRHWCATTLINLGVPLPVVAERLGHSSPAVTARIYAHVVKGRHEEAAGLVGRAVPFGGSFGRELASPEWDNRLMRTSGGFTTTPGRCFRMVENPDALGQPMSCPDPIAARGQFKDGRGELHEVDSCMRHVGDLEEFEIDGRKYRPAFADAKEAPPSISEES